MDNILYFFLLTIFAEIAGTIGGFGSSLFFIPIASYFLDIHSVLGVTAIFHILSNITKIYMFKKGFDKQIVMYLGIPATIFVILGAYLSKYMSSSILEILLGFFLIGLSLFFIVYKDIVIPANNTNAIGGGILSGFLAGLIGTGGAIRGMILASYNLSIDTYISTSAIIDLSIDFSRSIVYLANGFVHWHDMYLIPILFIATLIGTALGKKALTFISEKQFKFIVLLLVFFTGISILYKKLPVLLSFWNGIIYYF